MPKTNKQRKRPDGPTKEALDKIKIAKRDNATEEEMEAFKEAKWYLKESSRISSQTYRVEHQKETRAAYNEKLKKLVEKHSKIMSLRDKKYGNTLLHDAIILYLNNPFVKDINCFIQTLLSCGADFHAKNHVNSSPFDMLQMNGLAEEFTTDNSKEANETNGSDNMRPPMPVMPYGMYPMTVPYGIPPNMQMMQHGMPPIPGAQYGRANQFMPVNFAHAPMQMQHGMLPNMQMMQHGMYPVQMQHGMQGNDAPPLVSIDETESNDARTFTQLDDIPNNTISDADGAAALLNMKQSQNTSATNHK